MYLRLTVIVLAMGLPMVSSAQSISTARTLVDIGPVADECRVHTCIEATAARTGICAVEVLDASGSMDTNGRFAAALSGIAEFIDSLKVDHADQIGILGFSGPIRQFGATPLANPGPTAVEIIVDIGTSYDAIRGMLPGLSTNLYSALTPLAAGIEAAAAMLDECADSALRVLIVSTDGLPNWNDNVQCTVTPTAATACTDAALQTATEAKENGVHIVTIGIDLSPVDPSDAFGISLLRQIATSPEDANFFNTADGLSQRDIFAHLSRTVASPAEVTFFEPLPDSCWFYVPGSTTGSTAEDPVPGLLGDRQSLAWNLGIVADGEKAEICYSMGFDPACGESPASLDVQSGAEALWLLVDGRRESQSVESTRLPNIQACQIVFPVELTDFRATASTNYVTLEWQTASETDNAGFGIERASNGGAFQEIGFVPGGGTSLVSREYSYSDPDLSPGFYRYRLRQVDFDGSFEYSPVAEARIELPASHFMSPVFPNPASGQAHFELSVARAQQVDVRLLDVTGRSVRTVPSITVAGAQTESLTIDLSAIPAGLYAVHIRGEFFAATRLLVVTR